MIRWKLCSVTGNDLTLLIFPPHGWHYLASGIDSLTQRHPLLQTGCQCSWTHYVFPLSFRIWNSEVAHGTLSIQCFVHSFSLEVMTPNTLTEWRKVIARMRENTEEMSKDKWKYLLPKCTHFSTLKFLLIIWFLHSRQLCVILKIQRTKQKKTKTLHSIWHCFVLWIIMLAYQPTIKISLHCAK